MWLRVADGLTTQGSTVGGWVGVIHHMTRFWMNDWSTETPEASVESWWRGVDRELGGSEGGRGVGHLKTSFRKWGSCLRGPSALGEMETNTQPSCLPHRPLGAFEALCTMFGFAGKQPCRIHGVLPFSNRSINSPQSRLWLRRLVFKTTAPSQPP